jgi:phosphohistidine phosphatase
MDLLLWRHADAREAREGEADADRPLSAKGERQATRMAAWLNRHLPDTARVLVSPTLRTRQTAQALDRKVRLCEALQPGSGVEALLQAARWPDSRELVLIVGHQDTLGMTAAYLMAGIVQPWSVRKGALWWLRRRERAGRVEVVLQAVLSAEQV